MPVSKFKSVSSFVALKSKSAVVWVSKLVCTKAIAVSASDSFVSISLCNAASAAKALVSSAVIAADSSKAERSMVTSLPPSILIPKILDGEKVGVSKFWSSVET